MCGPAKRIWKLDTSKISDFNGMQTAAEAYDGAVVEGARVYGKRFHNLVLDNCHCHVAFVLNQLEYGGKKNWNQVRIFKEIWLRGKWVRRQDAILVFAPFLVLLSVLVGGLIFVGISNA